MYNLILSGCSENSLRAGAKFFPGVTTLYRALFFLLFSFIIITSTNGQKVEDIRLRLGYINDFREGYDSRSHSYSKKYIDNVLLDPPTRPILASILKSVPEARVRSSSTRDGRCDIETMRLISREVATLVWSLSRINPLTQKVEEIDRKKIDIKPYRPAPGAKCVLLIPAGTKPIRDNEGYITFNAPVPTGNETPNPEIEYTVQLTILDAGGRTLDSKSKRVSIPRYIPLIVSVGESLASGEGNPDEKGKSADDNYDPGDLVHLAGQRDCEDDASVMIYKETKPKMTRDPKWFDKNDHRSLRSGPAIAANLLLKEIPYVAFLSFAKSGSVISSRGEDYDIIEQLEHVKQLVDDHKIDILHISAGGNDVGFSDVLTTMAKDFRGSGAEKTLSHFINKVTILKNEKYPQIDAAIKSLKLKVGTVLINEYPGHLFNNRQGEPAGGCGVFESFRFWKVTKRDAVAMENMGNMLNDVVKDAAQKYGWTFVTGISAAFKRHGYCTGNQSFYRGATASCDMQGDFNGIMHPNEKGTDVYAQALYRDMRKIFRPVQNVQVHVGK